MFLFRLALATILLAGPARADERADLFQALREARTDIALPRLEKLLEGR